MGESTQHEPDLSNDSPERKGARAAPPGSVDGRLPLREYGEVLDPDHPSGFLSCRPGRSLDEMLGSLRAIDPPRLDWARACCATRIAAARWFSMSVACKHM
jgi:hypothetical protein